MKWNDVDFIPTKKLMVNVESIEKRLTNERWKIVLEKILENRVEVEFEKDGEIRKISFGNDGEIFENDERKYFWV